MGQKKSYADLLDPRVVVDTMGGDAVVSVDLEDFALDDLCLFLDRSTARSAAASDFDLKEGTVTEIVSPMASILSSRPAFTSLYCASRRWQFEPCQREEGSSRSSHWPQVRVLIPQGSRRLF